MLVYTYWSLYANMKIYHSKQRIERITSKIVEMRAGQTRGDGKKREEGSFPSGQSSHTAGFWSAIALLICCSDVLRHYEQISAMIFCLYSSPLRCNHRKTNLMAHQNPHEFQCVSALYGGIPLFEEGLSL